jgi:hypothetical protein
VQPSNRDRLWIERYEPSECADLRPNVADLTRDAFCGAKIVSPAARDAAQKQWDHSKSWCSAPSRSEQTRKTGIVGALPLLNSCCNVPTTRLKLGAWRPETVRYLLSQLGRPSKRIVRQIGEEGDNMKKGLPRT